MNGDTIKSFLVGLGFGVDDASLSKFNKAIASATLKVAALYGSIKVMSAAIFYGLSKISEGFEQLGYEYRIISPMLNKTLILRRELLKAYEAAGIHITKVIQSSIKLNMSLAKTKFALDAIYKSVGSRFFAAMTKQSDLFRQRIYANMPRIQKTLERMVRAVFKALEATMTLGTRLWSILGRVWDFFGMLDKATGGWSTRIFAVIAAWKLLNLEFLATPLGMLLTGLIAVLALFDDFKTWQEGGQSLFDWSTFLPVIFAVKDALAAVWSILQAITDVVGNLILSVYQLFQGDFTSAIDSLKQAGMAALSIFGKLWDTIKGTAGVLGSLGTWGARIFGDPNSMANSQSFVDGGTPRTAPVGSGVQNSQTNMNVDQKTEINVSSTADANSVARGVANQQSRVNFDMVRNMKGATR